MENRTEKAKSIFLAAIEKYQPNQWPTYLDGACQEDEELRAQVEQLLQAHAEMGSFHEATGDQRLISRRSLNVLARRSAHISCSKSSAKAVWGWSTWPNRPSRLTGVWP